MNKSEKIRKILNAIQERKSTAYELSKETGLNESGLNRFIKGEVSRPHTETVDKLYSYLYGNNTVSQSIVKSNLSDQEVKELVYLVATNEDRLMQEKVFANIIEIRVAKKVQLIMSSEEEYKKWRNS